MLRSMLKSKLHRIRVTEADLDYVGSLTLDEELMEAADILPFEQVRIYNISTGQRFETYVIKGPRGEGTVCLNGAAARMGTKGDLIIVASYGMVSPDEIKSGKSIQIWVDENNKIARKSVTSWIE